MKLIFSTDSFKVGNRSYEGFPILLHDNMQTFMEGLNFLIYYCIKRGRVGSKNSWVTYGRDLYDFFAFVDANELDWRNITSRIDSHILSVYRDAALKDFQLAESTVNRRLGLLVKFYKYAMQHGWVSALPYEIEEIRINQPKGFLAHTDKSGGVKASPDVLLKKRKTKIKVLNTEQVGMLLNAVKGKQDKLMIRLCLATGIRKEELLTIPKSYVVNPQRFSARNHNFVVTLSPRDMETKGSHERSIHIPRALMEDLWQFVIHERSVLSQKASQEYPNLFLNNLGRPFSVTSNALNQKLNKLGLPFSVAPHMLRHTFATHTLRALMERKDLKINPLMYVRDRLGHSSISITEKYLHFIDDVSDGVLNNYQEEIDLIIEGLTDA
jgi:integrase/recombinase XerD